MSGVDILTGIDSVFGNNPDDLAIAHIIYNNYGQLADTTQLYKELDALCLCDFTTKANIQTGMITSNEVSTTSNLYSYNFASDANIVGTQMSAGASIMATQLNPHIVTCLGGLSSTWDSSAVSALVACFSFPN